MFDLLSFSYQYFRRIKKKKNVTYILYRGTGINSIKKTKQRREKRVESTDQILILSTK